MFYTTNTCSVKRIPVSHGGHPAVPTAGRHHPGVEIADELVLIRVAEARAILERLTATSCPEQARALCHQLALAVHDIAEHVRGPAEPAPATT